MKIGVSSKNDFSDFAESSMYLPSEAIVYDVELPLDVERALSLVRNNFGSSAALIPTAVQSYHGHGEDCSLEFREMDFEDVNLNPNADYANFTKRNLVARISFGMKPVNKRVLGDKLLGTIYREPRFLNRLHLNVFGARKFLPENFRENQGLEKDRFLYNKERIHFSMRWLDGKFDYVWNDFGESGENLNSKTIGLNEMRTTYMSSKCGSDSINGAFARELILSENNFGARGKKVSLEDVGSILGIGKKILPVNLTREEALANLPKSFDLNLLDQVYGYYNSKKRDFEIVGYSPVLNILSMFSEDVYISDVKKIPNMGMTEGVDYMFNKILPAMKKYTYTK